MSHDCGQKYQHCSSEHHLKFKAPQFWHYIKNASKCQRIWFQSVKWIVDFKNIRGMQCVRTGIGVCMMVSLKGTVNSKRQPWTTINRQHHSQVYYFNSSCLTQLEHPALYWFESVCRFFLYLYDILTKPRNSFWHVTQITLESRIKMDRNYEKYKFL